MSGWPTITLRIEGYTGWEVTAYELSLQEVTDYENKAAELRVDVETDSIGLNDFMEILLPAIVGWNFTDREGNKLPIATESLGRLPLRVIGQVTAWLMGGVGNSLDPKAMPTFN